MLKDAKELYSNLNSDQKALVENLDKLEALEKGMGKMVKEAIEEKSKK